MNIPLSKPDITEKEKKAVLEVLNTSNLSLGKKYLEFEKIMAKYARVKYAVAVNSGTSGLHLIIRALGIGERDEVITTPFSFIASSNCLLFEKAKQVFVDIDKDTLCIDVKKIEEKITKKTKAILVVDIFSHPCDWEELEKIAKKYNLFLIEDSAEALGSKYKGRRCGSFGDAGIFAFYPNKQITTGEGGIILTDNKKIYELCRSMANQGRKVLDGRWLEHVRLGYNYRLDEMSCALGISQIERIGEILKDRKKVAELYNEKLKNIPEIEIPYIGKNADLSWFVYVIKIKKSLSSKRNLIIKKMSERGVQCGNYFQPIHLQPFYKKIFGYKKGDFPATEDAGKRTVALPFHTKLTEEEIDFVVKNLKELINEYI